MAKAVTDKEQDSPGPDFSILQIGVMSIVDILKKMSTNDEKYNKKLVASESTGYQQIEQAIISGQQNPRVVDQPQDTTGITAEKKDASSPGIFKQIGTLVNLFTQSKQSTALPSAPSGEGDNTSLASEVQVTNKSVSGLTEIVNNILEVTQTNDELLTAVKTKSEEKITDTRGPASAPAAVQQPDPEKPVIPATIKTSDPEAVSILVDIRDLMKEKSFPATTPTAASIPPTKTPGFASQIRGLIHQFAGGVTKPERVRRAPGVPPETTTGGQMSPVKAKPTTSPKPEGVTAVKGDITSRSSTSTPANEALTEATSMLGEATAENTQSDNAVNASIGELIESSPTGIPEAPLSEDDLEPRSVDEEVSHVHISNFDEMATEFQKLGILGGGPRKVKDGGGDYTMPGGTGGGSPGILGWTFAAIAGGIMLVKLGVEKVWEWTKAGLGALWDLGSAALEGIWDFSTGLASTVWDWTKGAAEQLWEWGGAAVDAVGEFASDTWSAVKEVGGEVATYVGDAVDAVGTFASDTYDSVSEGIDSAVDWAGDVAEGALETASKAADAIGEVAGSIASAAGDAMASVGDFASDAWDTVADSDWNPVNWFNKGGWVSGGVEGKDSVPAVLTPGEYVIPERQAAQYEQLGLIPPGSGSSPVTPTGQLDEAAQTAAEGGQPHPITEGPVEGKSEDIEAMEQDTSVEDYREDTKLAHEDGYVPIEIPEATAQQGPTTTPLTSSENLMEKAASTPGKVDKGITDTGKPQALKTAESATEPAEPGFFEKIWESITSTVEYIGDVILEPRDGEPKSTDAIKGDEGKLTTGQIVPSLPKEEITRVKEKEEKGSWWDQIKNTKIQKGADGKLHMLTGDSLTADNAEKAVRDDIGMVLTTIFETPDINSLLADQLQTDTARDILSDSEMTPEQKQEEIGKLAMQAATAGESLIGTAGSLSSSVPSLQSTLDPLSHKGGDWLGDKLGGWITGADDVTTTAGRVAGNMFDLDYGSTPGLEEPSTAGESPADESWLSKILSPFKNMWEGASSTTRSITGNIQDKATEMWVTGTGAAEVEEKEEKGSWWDQIKNTKIQKGADGKLHMLTGDEDSTTPKDEDITPIGESRIDQVTGPGISSTLGASLDTNTGRSDDQIITILSSVKDSIDKLTEITQQSTEAEKASANISNSTSSSSSSNTTINNNYNKDAVSEFRARFIQEQHNPGNYTK